VVFVQAEELPKGALVEFQVNFHTGRPGSGAGEDIEEDDLEAELSSGSTGGMSWEVCSANIEGQGGRAMVYLHGKSRLAHIA
jgi:diphthine-ammonia ligase